MRADIYGAVFVISPTFQKRVRRIFRAYLLTMQYYAQTATDSYYSALVSHDLNLKKACEKSQVLFLLKQFGMTPDTVEKQDKNIVKNQLIKK